MADEVRLIDVNALLNKIDEINPVDYGGIYNYEAHVAARSVLADVKLIINNTSTIYAEPDNGWISVDDRLPEIKEHYRSELVMCYSPDGEHEYLFDYYEMNGFGQGCFTAEKYFGITITHWKPLPKPPKED